MTTSGNLNIIIKHIISKVMLYFRFCRKRVMNVAGGTRRCFLPQLFTCSALGHHLSKIRNFVPIFMVNVQISFTLMCT